MQVFEYLNTIRTASSVIIVQYPLCRELMVMAPLVGPEEIYQSNYSNSDSKIPQGS